LIGGDAGCEVASGNHGRGEYRFGAFLGSEIAVAVFRRRELAVEIAVGAELAVRVTAGMDIPEGVDVDVGVNLRGFDSLVAEHFLHVADVGTATMHVGGATVPPQMAGTGFVDAAAFEEFFDPVAKVGGTEARAVTAEEECGFPGQVVEKGAGLGEEAVEPCGGALADGEHPAFAVLALANDQSAGGGIVVAVIEVGHFRAADAGGVNGVRPRGFTKLCLIMNALGMTRFSRYLTGGVGLEVAGGEQAAVDEFVEGFEGVGDDLVPVAEGVARDVDAVAALEDAFGAVVGAVVAVFGGGGVSDETRRGSEPEAGWCGGFDGGGVGGLGPAVSTAI
jgi:hypothetical protein